LVSLDFVADTLVSGRRFRILAVVDDFTRECLALVVDASLTGACELDRIAELRGYPCMIVSDTSNAWWSRRRPNSRFEFWTSNVGSARVPSRRCSRTTPAPV
jgi:transposase InsO family protein